MSWSLWLSSRNFSIFMNSSLIRCSWMIFLSLCVTMTSCIKNPNHICETMSMFGMASLFLMFGIFCELEMVGSPPDSLLLHFPLWLLNVVAIIGLVWDGVGGVISAKLMVSSQKATTGSGWPWNHHWTWIVEVNSLRAWGRHRLVACQYHYYKRLGLSPL